MGLHIYGAPFSFYNKTKRENKKALEKEPFLVGGWIVWPC